VNRINRTRSATRDELHLDAIAIPDVPLRDFPNSQIAEISDLGLIGV